MAAAFVAGVKMLILSFGSVECLIQVTPIGALEQAPMRCRFAVFHNTQNHQEGLS
jgi:hypothetical protein